VVLPKKNCDASFQKNLKSAGWGFVFSDDNGDVIQAARGKLNHVLDVFQAELIACLQGLLILASQKSFLPLMLSKCNKPLKLIFLLLM
jgi:ribonuclease HI